jgi:hypothetical protein
MKTNENSVDRALRIVLGVALLGLTISGTIGIWGWLGIVPLATGAIGWCPLYAMLGISTCPVRNAS